MRKQVASDRMKNSNVKNFEMAEKSATKDGASKPILAEVERYQC